ncbi:OmpA family protein [Pseudoxanthomonas winnipegensis]|uniref:OmpA family protein n=1 Tax=Pseudoxanthomonas winnipegensis TaxID=2480810 RepID=A0A4Q8LAX0_9GAMM|nr:OmpA family protein [Pseudoxanthomonas winnipegensis]TAA25767.1 OmpA family protein [Pseudoxanthomonas winnipegensis]
MSKKIAGLFLAALCGACTVARHANAQNDAPPTISGLEMAPINFKKGEPRNPESLNSSLDGDFAVAAINRDLLIVKKYRSLRFEILGFTDTEECAPSDCQKLSASRAEAVHGWLIAHGADPSSFKRVEGLGAEMPIADNSTEEGRSVNRRVEVNQVPSRSP